MFGSMVDSIWCALWLAPSCMALWKSSSTSGVGEVEQFEDPRVGNSECLAVAKGHMPMRGGEVEIQTFLLKSDLVAGFSCLFLLSHARFFSCTYKYTST